MNHFKKASGPKTLADFPEHSETSPLSIHDMTVAYHKKPVLWDIEYDAPEKSLIAIVGPNGAGKSTLMKACLNLIPKASGRVEFWGQDYASQRGRIGYVPQRESVDWDFPISAVEVVVMGRYGKLGWFRRPRLEDRDFAMTCLTQMGMEAYAHRQINQLSGGQQQRVFLARALAQEADLYFMDEPFAGVDASTEKAIVTVLENLKAQGKSVICVHHDLQTVSSYFDHVILLNTRIVAQGPVEAVFTKENLKLTYGGRLTLLDEVAQAMAVGHPDFEGKR